MVVRDAAGPGWALVGDAGQHRDPVTGHGITDAFRDAELLATAVDDWLTRAPGSREVERTSLGSYQQRRDALAGEVFRLTDALTRYPAPEAFVALQRELAEALDREAAWLAGLPVVGSRRSAQDLVPA
jgi:2-polyprenyl-6-methoxyphenol hydroxylase-like FAD-dependent oxidoreductase